MDDASSKVTGKQHWIYVLGGAEVLQAANAWAARKAGQGKQYGVIDGASSELPQGRLIHVGPDDVLYVLATEVRDGRLGEARLEPETLAGRLRAEGLGLRHREVKVFASGSGDGAGRDSFAARLYEAMRLEYPRVLVSGYLGVVNVDGFDGHKTAGLGKRESLEAMSREAWFEKGARAKDNRVQFRRQWVGRDRGADQP